LREGRDVLGREHATEIGLAIMHAEQFDANMEGNSIPKEMRFDGWD
jgi:hypothetical protein